MTLRTRCEAFRDTYGQMGYSTDDLVNFVVSELGRLADERLDKSYPLCLYFGNDQDRREFVDAVVAAKPGMVSKTWP